VAFNAGNIEAVAKILRGKLPAMRLILCADNDRFKSTGNKGLTSASKAAQAVSGLLAVPQFNSDINEPTDFNDLHKIEGLAAIKAAIDGAIHAADKKEKPEPLPEMPSVLPFDYDYLPDALRGYVHDISERMQCPPDFAAVTVFVMMATIIGRKVTMRPMKKDDWTVTCNLWGAVVGSSGVMKSPTMSAAIKPLKKMQAAAYDEFNEAAFEFNSQQEIAKLQKGVNKGKARDALKKGTAAHEARDLLKVGGLDDIPVMKRFIANDVTYQALGELLIDSPNGLLYEKDEIIGLLKSLDSDGQQEARSFFLTAADGDKSYTFDRIVRGKCLHIPAVCLSIIGGIQPGVLAEYVRQAVSGGAGADGLLQRFALMVYPDISPNWKEVDRYPDKEARHAVDDLCARMEFINVERIGAEVDLFGGIPFLRFDDNAQKVFSEWRFALEHRLRSADEHPALVSHFSKYRKLIPSLALINHLCDSPEGGSVTEQALIRSIAFSEYLESHARRIYSFGTRPDIDAAKSLIHRIKTGKLSSPFTLRDIYRPCWTGLETPSKAQSAVNVLLEYSHLIEKVTESGGRSITAYCLNIGA
jgi:putative DNA primase/helicase